MGKNMKINKNTIVKGLQNLHLMEGSLIMAHCSLSAFGFVAGGANTIIDAIMEVIGETGTLLVPTHTGSFSPEKAFDLHKSPSRVGAFTETLRLRQGALRSFHPTHSDVAFGKLAYELIKDHQNTTAVGRLSPVGKLLSLEGYILLLGVDFDACTTIHAIEEMLDLPYSRNDTGYVVKDGGVIAWSLKKAPGHSAGFVKISPYLQCEGLISETKIGNARVQLVKASDLVRVGTTLLTKNPGALLDNQILKTQLQNTEKELHRIQKLLNEHKSGQSTDVTSEEFAISKQKEQDTKERVNILKKQLKASKNGNR